MWQTPAPWFCMSTADNEFKITPIGFFKCISRYPSEVPRQPYLSDNSGVIEIDSRFNYTSMLQGLEGFSHIWVQFLFHKNEHYKTMTAPPYMKAKKVGTWASRSPYRPNRLGLSCLQLEGIEGRRLYVKNHDLLDGTPVLDIKPYVTQSDSHAQAKQGWLEDVEYSIYDIEFSHSVKEKIEFLRDCVDVDFYGFINTQLRQDPLDLKKKRIKPLDENLFVIAHRTWRVIYQVEKTKVQILDITSGYEKEQLARVDEDPYGDKLAHRHFIYWFSC